MYLDPSRLNKRISIGTVESHENANGINVSSYVEKFNLWCGIWKRSMNQTFQVIGTDRQDDVTVIIRHNHNVNNSLLAKLNDVEYQIINVEPDESTAIIAYDFLTLRKKSK